MFRKLTLILTLLIIAAPFSAWSWPSDCQYDATVEVFGYPEYDMTGGSNTPGSSRTFYSDTLYVLVGHCVVDDGCEITVEPGTVFWGAPLDYSDLHSEYATDIGAIVVARGGVAHMSGTETEPIVMTAYGDDMCDPYDIPYNSRGLWGGLIICGYAETNSAGGGKSAEGQIEGLETVYYGLYGCTDIAGNCDDADYSGEYQYLSLRHGGHAISSANEINGISFGAVGYSTVVDHCEVYANEDDGYEFFGGTVGCKYMVVAYGADDCFDYDEGWRGLNQFWLSIYTTDAGDKNGEHDGGTSPEDGEPYAIPIIYNATYVGGGPDMVAGGNSGIFAMRDNNGGQYVNSIFTKGTADFIQQLENVGPDPTKDSEWMLRQGNISFYDNLIVDMGNWSGTKASVIKNGGIGGSQEYVTNYFDGAIGFHGLTNRFSGDPGNDHLNEYWWGDWDINGSRFDPRYVVDPANEVIDPAPDYSFTQCPPFCSPTWPPQYDPQLADTDPSSYFDVVDYRGAFGPATENNLDPLWIRGWTHLWERGITPYICGDVNIDNSINILDVVYLINYKYKGGAGIYPLQVGDVNKDNGTNILDVVYLINFKYKSGPAPICF